MTLMRSGKRLGIDIDDFCVKCKRVIESISVVSILNPGAGQGLVAALVIAITISVMSSRRLRRWIREKRRCSIKCSGT